MIKLNKFVKLFISCQLILLQLSAALSENQTRILSGTPTTIDKAPYMVQLRINGGLHCGGFLITEEYVVTAGHCVKNKSPRIFEVVGGASRITDNGVSSRVSKIMIPTSYDEHTYDMDVALMKLKTPMRGTSIRPTGKCTKTWKHGDTVQLLGWGKIQENNNNMPLQLQTVNVSIIDQGICERQYSQRMMITPSMFCAGAPGKDACGGDSGSPVLVNGEPCGIVSWGIGCGRIGSPGVYTRLPYVWPFVTTAMQQ